MSTTAARIHAMCGRTYRLAGLDVRIVRVDADTVTFGSATKDIRLTNSTFTHDQFFQLDLQEV